MAGAPPPCNPVATPPAGAATVCITWFAHWPILFTDCPPISAYESTLLVIHNTGGAIYSIEFKDGSGAVIPGDWCSGAPPVVVNPPPPPKPAPPPPLPDPGDDELTINFNALFTYLIQLINLIQHLTTQPGSPPGETNTCCRSIVQALHNLTLVVAKIEATLVASDQVAPPAIDLSAVVFELTCLCEKLTLISESSATVATDLAPGLKSISDAITNAKPIDLDKLIKAILHAGEAQQGPDWIKQLAVQSGVFTAEQAQLMGDYTRADIADGVLVLLADLLLGSKDILGKWIKPRPLIVLEHVLPSFLDWFISNAAAQVKKAHASGIASSPEWRQLGNDLLTLFQEVFGGFGKFAVETLIQDISPEGDVQSSQGVDNFSTMIANASALAGAAWSAATVGGIALGEHSKHLNYFAALFAMGAGYDAIAEGALGAFIHPTVVNPSRQHWNKLYRSHIPDDNAAASMFARGLLDSRLFKEAVAAAGLRSDFEDAHEKSAYSGLNARMLLRLAGTGLFTDADVTHELTFGGMRAESQHRLILAATYLGTEPERNKLRAAFERLYAAGLASDSDLVQLLQSAEHNHDRFNLQLEAGQVEKRIALAKEYEAAWSNEFRNGLLDPAAFQSQLEGLGMQPPDVAARIFRDQSHLLVTQTLGAERAARAAAKRTEAEERKIAVEGFRTGILDAATLTTALSLAGLTAAQTAAEVGYQVLASSGALRWIYGRHLSPQDATLLRQQVADLTRQREIEMLTDAQYVAQLSALSIPHRVIQALRAGANAHISPKTKAILTPPI